MVFCMRRLVVCFGVIAAIGRVSPQQQRRRRRVGKISSSVMALIPAAHQSRTHVRKWSDATACKKHSTTTTTLQHAMMNDNNHNSNSNSNRNKNKPTTTRNLQEPKVHAKRSQGGHQRRPRFPLMSSRRTFLWSLPIACTAVLGRNPEMSRAALIQFPQPIDKPFANTYHFMRVGTTLLEEQDIWSTNPLFMTNREDALSETGYEQVLRACQALKRSGPSVIRYSLAAAATDTVDAIARELNLGRDRLGAEFTFLDPRAIGQWDMLNKTAITPAVWAMDVMEAGADGTGARPPPNTDGTPHETLADQMIRLRQLFSLLETQYSGDTVLLVFPDGTGPAVLSAMIAGFPLNRVHELEFEPGELRMNVTRESVEARLRAHTEDYYARYEQAVAQGRIKLQELRSTPSSSLVNLKDERIEAERIEIDQEYNQQLALKRQSEAQEQEQERQERILAQQNRDADGTPQIFAAAAASFAAVLGGTQVFKTAKKEEDLVFATSSPSSNTTTMNNTSSSLSSYFGSSSGGAARAPVSWNRTTTVSTDTPQVIRRPQTVNGDLRATFIPPPSPLDPYAAAQRAMDDYMSQDDGADAWLASLSQILTEEEDDDEGEMSSSSSLPSTPPGKNNPSD